MPGLISDVIHMWCRRSSMQVDEYMATEQQLAAARADSSRLRSQLAVKMSISYHENGYSADNATVCSKPLC